MVAIVSGNSLGLSLTSLANLGHRGTFGTAGHGRSGEQSFVNVATGNLVLQGRDDGFMARGMDFTALRTYNSQGLLNDDNADNWLVGAAAQRVELTGAVGTAGSTVAVTGRDGARSVYVWDAANSRYVGTAGAGAFDTLRYDGAASQFVWADGDTGLIERYQATGRGHLVSSQDPSGNTLTYSYRANGTLEKAENANGEVTLFVYSGANLTQIRTVSGGVATTTVRYEYDTQNRLASVIVDLSPEDGSIDDGRVYRTTYTYDGASTRIASVTQSDGTRLAFSYVLSGGVYKVASVTDALGAVTRYSYDTAANTTTVTDALGAQSVYLYDPDGQLLQVREGVTATRPAGLTRVSYVYDHQGNVASTTDGAGNTIVFEYDDRGNQVLQRDAAGNTVTRTFDASNRLLTETVFAMPDPDGAGAAQPATPLTTRYVYDAGNKNLLRFEISPQGRVIEHRYDGHGQRTSSIEYAAQAYDATWLGATGVASEADMTSWTVVQDKSRTLRTDLTYDALGQLESRTTYAQVGADGLGVASTGSITQYVFDRRGLLIQEFAPDHAGVTNYVHDGLGRLLAVTRASLDGGLTANTTITSYDDANGRTTLTLANGLVTTQAFDRAGRLVSITESSLGTGVLGTTTYAYDQDGRLRMIQDPTGARSWMLYDEAGRKVADIDAAGAVTEYLYGADGQLRATIAYATAIDAAQLASDGSPLDLDALRPGTTAQDQKLWRLYDAAGRLAWEVDASGAVTRTDYDGASRVTSVTRLAKPLTAVQLAQLDSASDARILVDAQGVSYAQLPGDVRIATVADTAADRTTTELHDRDGRVIGRIDGEGYLTEYKYDAAGQLVQTVFHDAVLANRAATVAAARTSHALSGLQFSYPYGAYPSPVRVYHFHDARGQRVGQLDGGYLTEYVHDARGQVVQTIRYARMALAPGAAPTLASVRPVALPEDQIVTQTWDAAGQLVSRVNAEGTVTRFVYDSVGQLVQITTAAGTGDERTARRRYDIQGNLIGELDGRGSLAVAAGEPGAEWAAWVANGTTHTFDAAGRLASSTDANGHRTLFFYDAVGRLTHTVNALGEVRESRYNALGQLAEEVAYGTRIDLAALGAASAGGLVTATIANAIATIADSTKDSHVLHSYTATGTRASRTDALGQVTSYSYNAFREAVESRQQLASGYVVLDTAAFDRRGLQTRTTQDLSGANVAQYTRYDAFGRPMETSNAYGIVSRQEYDPRGNLVATANALGAIRRTAFDAFGRVLSFKDAVAGQSPTYSYFYDTAQRSVTIIKPGTSATTVHNRHGQAQVEIDERGNATHHAHDASGNRVETRNALGATTTSTYDKANRLTSTTDANGIVTTYAYDAANRLISTTRDPLGLNLTTRYGYDAKGQQVSVTDPRGTVTTVEFDLAGQVVRQTEDAGGLNLQTVYTHDANGTVLTVSDPNGTLTRYTYDGAGRRIKEQVDPLGLNLTRNYTYDQAGNVVKAVDARGNATLYIYDKANQLAYTIDALGYVSQRSYNAEGWLLGEAWYAVALSAQTLATLGATVTLASTFLTQHQPTLGPSITQTRRYDDMGRLTFSVDGNGNVTGYGYDEAGNVSSITSYANAIDLSRANANPVPDAVRDIRIRFGYDALNRLSWKVDGTGAVTHYAYDANGNLIEERRLATPMTPSALAAWNGKTAPNVPIDPSRDQVVRTVHDSANRAILRVDAAGGVTQLAYDANGNVIETLRPAKALDAAVLAAWDGKSAAALLAYVVSDPARDARVRMVHDAANRQTWSVDGAGCVVHSQYDNNGNLIEQRAFANALPAGTPATGQALGQATANLVDDAHDRHLRYVYDAVNRQTWRVEGGANGTGAVVHVQYDGNGNVVDRRDYASAVSLPPMLDEASLAAATAASADKVRDVHTRSVYDATNRLAWQADGTGAVTGFGYDGFGNLVRTVQYANAIGSAQSPADVVPSGADRVSVMAYDASRRLTFVVDALGGVTRTVRDAFGNVTQQIAYAKPVTPPDASGPLGASNSLYTDAALRASVAANANPNADRVQRSAYDQANRLVFSIDALGGAIEANYDAFGHAVRTTRYSRAVNATDLSATASVNEVRARIVPDAASDRVTHHVFDAAGREVYQVDGLGHVTRTDHDALGQALSTTRYALAIPAIPAGTAPSAAAIAQAVLAVAADRTQTKVFDAAGRVVSSTDAMGFTESWSYDAVGNNTQYTNAKGAVWTYTHDSAGRVLYEYAPPVDLTTVTPRADGRLELDESTTGSHSITTMFGYDALGNLVMRVEAHGRPEQRDTLYQYDALGRQVRVTYPSVHVYDSTADTSSPQRLYTETTYDALGNAVANRDIGGNVSYKTHDLLGRVAFEVDALGFVTGYMRNTFGDAEELTRYGRASGLAAGLQTAQVQTALAALAALTGLEPTLDRTIETRFDRAGRAIQVTEGSGHVFDASLAEGTQDFQGAKTTRNTFNTFGELVQVAQLKARDAVNGEIWTLTTHFFDKAGQQVATIDAMGHVTTQAHDAVGNVTARSEYARAVVGWAGTGDLKKWSGQADQTALLSLPEAHADDRHTLDTFDANNRKVAEKRLNVEFSTASNGTSARGELETTYGYDAVGNLTRTTDAAGASTYSYYDALGRVRAVAEPTRQGADSRLVTPLTVFHRDAHGNVVMKTQYANGAASEGSPLAPQGLPPPPQWTAVENPELADLTRDGYFDAGSPGYMSITSFPGSVAMHRFVNHLGQSLYGRPEEIALLPGWDDRGVVGYLCATGTPGTRELVRLVQPEYGGFTLVSDPLQLLALGREGWVPNGTVGWIAEHAGAPLDTALAHRAKIILDAWGDNQFVAATVAHMPGPDLDAIARADRTSYARYDALGHLVQTTDATGVNHFSAYNAQGLLAKDWQQVTDGDGNVQTIQRNYTYDELGRQTHVLEPGGDTEVRTELRYNAFGEVVQKLVNGEQGEYFDYDRAGRLWRTNAGDGIHKVALYDLQGNQTADIRSAGLARGDLNLKPFTSADQVAGLRDVRRTDTTYDLLGRVVRQALAERLEGQGGLQVSNDAISGGVAASASPSPYDGVYEAGHAWMGTNTVNLHWTTLAGLGSGEVRVSFTYITRDADGNEGPPRTREHILDAAAGASGASVSWQDDPLGTHGGIARVTHIRVEKKDVHANWQPVLAREGFGDAGQSVRIALPADAQAHVQVQYRLAGSNGAWTEQATPHLANFGDSLRLDLKHVPRGSYEYQVLTTVAGQPTQRTAGGTWTITPRPLSTIQTAGVNEAAQTLEWQGPGNGDQQVLRFRAAGSNDAWVAHAITYPGGNAWSVADLAGLAGGDYEYELLWSRPGDDGPYAHATGVIHKTAGTSEIVVSPPVAGSALPHIHGLEVVKGQFIPGVLLIPDSVRLPNPLLARGGGLWVWPQGHTEFTQVLTGPVVGDPDGDGDTSDAHAIVVPRNMLPGTYSFSYQYVDIFGNATAETNGTLILGADGSITLTENPYIPSSPGEIIPGTPARYAWTVTDKGAYAVSEEPSATNRVISQAIGDVNGLSSYQRPSVLQNVDRWGNVVSISDPRSAGWATTYRYNANNQLVEQVQTNSDGIAGRNADGSIRSDAAVTRIYYDAMGRQVAIRDANGHVNGRVYDAAGQLAHELQADGGLVSHLYDAFGDKALTMDALGHVTWFLHDQSGRLVRTTRAGEKIPKFVERQTWDEAGRLTSSTNGNGETIRYAYDARGNLIRTTLAMGQHTHAAYDALNRKISETDANGHTATWTYDYFGALIGHTDIGAASYLYVYDNARHLVAQSNTRGQNKSFAYDAAGQLIGITDHALGNVSTYRYDLAGRRIRETTTQGGETYQDNHIAYDALGRMRWIADARATITIDYDLVGNRTRIRTHVNDLVTEDTDRHYQYDAMNRQTVVDAVDASGNLGATGHRLTYDANGNRTSDTRNGLRLVEAGGPGSDLWAAQAGETTEVYGYDELGRLATTDRDGVRVDRRTYDAAHRVISSGPGALSAGYMALHRLHMGTTGNDPLQGRQNEYDANGRLRHQDTFEYGVSLTGVNYEYDEVGNVVKTLSVPVEADPAKRSFTTTTYELKRFEGYKVASSVSATRRTANEHDVPQSLAGLAYAYDVNGHLISTGDAGQITNPTLRTHNFVNDAAGNALHASYSAEGAGQREHAQRQLVVNGEVLGRYGEVADQRFEGFPVPQFKGEAQFSFGYQPINGNYPAGSPGTYAVAAGDTLRSIAKGAFGDASLWYLIADANGLSSDADLRSGQVLTIPARVASANNAETFRPYDPSKIANDSPTMLALPGNDKGCGGVGQIIMVAVAVAVAYFTAGAAVGAISSGAYGSVGAAAAGGAYGTAAAGAAIGGAVGSVASQAVGISIGGQDSFSWKQVALSAVGGAVSGGLAGASALQVTGNAFVDGAIRGAVASAATQGVAVVTGLQSSFSWRSVAASAVSAGVAQGLNSTMGYNPALNGFEFGKSLLTGVTGSVVGQAVRGGKVDATTLATDAFGNILSDSLAAANNSGDVLGDFIKKNDHWAGVAAAAPLVAGGAAILNQANWSRVPGAPGYAYGLGGSDEGITSRQANAAAKAEQSTSLESLGRSELGKGPAASNDELAAEMNAQRDLNLSVARRAANAAYNGNSAMASHQLLGGGPGGITNVKPLNSDAGYGFTNAELASMHTENTNRAQRLAAESAAASGGGSSMWVDGSGVPHILVSGVGSTASPDNAAESAAPRQPAPVSNLDAFNQGWRGDGWSVLEHGTQPKPFAYGLGGGTRAVFDSLTGAGAIDRSRQAFANGQSTRGVIHTMQAVGEAGLTAMSLGTYALAKSAVVGVTGMRGATGTAAQLDLSAQFNVTRGGGGMKVQYGDPDYWPVADASHGLVGFADKNGIVGFNVFANPELRATHGSGSDMFTGMLKRLDQEGVRVQGIRGAWEQGADSVNYLQYRNGLASGLTPEQAALNTWTGKQAQQHGFTVVESVVDKTNVYATFRKPY